MCMNTTGGPPVTCCQQSAGVSSEHNTEQRVSKGQGNIETQSPWNNPQLEKNPTAELRMKPGTANQ